MRRVKVTCVCAAAVAATAFAAWVGIGSAATPPPTFTVTVAPKPVVTERDTLLAVAKLAYASGAKPTTLTHVFFTLAIPAGSFDATLSDSTCSPNTAGDQVTCLVGNVRAGDTVARHVALTAPAPQALTISGRAFWNEAVNDNNPQPPNDSSATASDSTSVVAFGAQDAAGTCSKGSAALATKQEVGADNQQATSVTSPQNTQGLPCTPVAVQDDQTVSGVTCGSRPCRVSFVTLPEVAPLSATDTITFDGSLFPPPGPRPNPSTFVVSELLGPTDGTPEPVPLCASGKTTSAGACESSAERFGSRGIRVLLRLGGTTIDPGYAG